MTDRQLIVYEGAAFTVEWFYDEKGRSSALEFFEGLPEERQAAFLALVRRLAQTGQIRNETKFRNEGHKIFAFKPQPERFLCFFFVGRKVIITNGFVKKTKKLPPTEKERALDAKRSYEERVKERRYYEALEEI